MAWDPIFSPDGADVAAKIALGKNYFLALNAKLVLGPFEEMWDPVFSPGGDRILIKCVEEGHYLRKIVPVKDLLRK
jgi:hypothetical protein